MVLIKSDWSILAARSVSFLSAVTCTWLVNRFWTFELVKQVGVRREYAAYMTVQVVGALVNLTLFFVLIELHPLLESVPLIPLAFGATFALAFNYTISKKYVFIG